MFLVFSHICKGTSGLDATIYGQTFSHFVEHQFRMSHAYVHQPPSPTLEEKRGLLDM